MRALGARRNVGERVAVLVDVDRHAASAPSRRPRGIAGGKRLLAVLDAELGELREKLERLVRHHASLTST